MFAPRLFPPNFLSRIGRMLLVLAVLTSSLAWMPSTAQAAPQAEASAKPNIDGWIVGPRLYVEASGLPRSHSFNLRARRSSNNDWTKLTRVQSNRRGELVISVRLPSQLARADRLQVCLKDKKTDRVYCVKARRSD